MKRTAATRKWPCIASNELKRFQRNAEVSVVSARKIQPEIAPQQVAVRQSPIHGHGVFAVSPLPGRRKIGELHGEIVRLPQARRTVEGQERIYLVELSRRFALDCSQGNEFKFLNHSCRPNCYLRVVRRVIEVYTLRPVAAGAELTVDYGETPHKGGMTCGCGREDCRQRL